MNVLKITLKVLASMILLGVIVNLLPESLTQHKAAHVLVLISAVLIPLIPPAVFVVWRSPDPGNYGPYRKRDRFLTVHTIADLNAFR